MIKTRFSPIFWDKKWLEIEVHEFCMELNGLLVVVKYHVLGGIGETRLAT